MTATATNPPTVDQAAASAAADHFWDAEPGTVIPRPPLFLTVIAEPGLGKTHLALTFPGPGVLCDSEFRGDEVLRKFVNIDKYWKKIDCFNDVRQAVGRALQKHAKTPGTIIFDSGSDLQLLAEAEVLAKLEADSKKAHKTLHWGPVNKIFKELFGLLRDRRWNAVFTARLKDEWRGDDRTGARVAGGFVTDKLIYHSDFALRLEMREGKRVGVVLKNGAKKPGTYRTVLEDAELNFAGIVKEMEADASTLVAASPPAIVMASAASIATANTNTKTTAGGDPCSPPSARNEAVREPEPVAPAVAPAGPRPSSAPAPASAPAAVDAARRGDSPQQPLGATIPHHAVCVCGNCPNRTPEENRAARAENERQKAAYEAAKTKAAAPAAEPPASPAAEVLAEPYLNMLGFFKTGRPSEGYDLDLDKAAGYGREWDDARRVKNAGLMVTVESTLARGGWIQKPTSERLAPPELVAEIEKLTTDIGSNPDTLWAKIRANGWSQERGRIPLDHALLMRERLAQTKTALNAQREAAAAAEKAKAAAGASPPPAAAA